MKGMFLCKHARQDLFPGIVFLASCVKEPNKGEWKKLLRMLNYLEMTKEDITNMSANDTQTIKWYVDSSFAVHKDIRSYTGAIMTFALCHRLGRPGGKCDYKAIE
jgi:hypothetical protein